MKSVAKNNQSSIIYLVELFFVYFNNQKAHAIIQLIYGMYQKAHAILH